ncbi:autotransporter outer membrane beta-barrel domain-containing protein, partial [Stenotrophomonas sp. HMWF022]
MSALSSPASLPLPRPLAVGVLLALAIAPAGMAHAGDLDNQTAEVVAGDPVEAWRLINGSKLTITGAQSNQIIASDSSTIVLDGAQVTRVGRTNQSSIDLYGNASLEATNSRFAGGGITVNGEGASAHLVGSTISVRTADMRPDEIRAIGVDLINGGSATGATRYARIDGTRIDVQDVQNVRRWHSSGLGVRMQSGTVDIVNGSSVTGVNVGALLWGVDSPTGVIRLNVDDSILQSGRGAAIHVLPLLDNTYDITVANDAHLLGGDGNLLLVASDVLSDARTDVDFTVDNARLRGNVTFDPATVTNGTLDVILRNKAQIDGRFLNVTSASIDGDSTWLLTGDSNVSRLTLGSTGTIGLGDGTTFNTLTVDSFTGNGGTLAFNTHLGDDASATDKLVITGDANGQANVHVLNAGGTGAKTDRGIELIDIGGASNAQFDLVGRAVGGQYEYFLVKDTNGNWYLRSALATVPDPCVVDPSLPECKPIDPVDPVDPVDPPPPVLRPEAGAYLANQFAMDQLLRHGWRDRQGGDATAEGVRGWARVDGTQSKLSAVEDQLDLRVQRSRLQLGADVGVFDSGRGRVGAMLTAGQADAQSRSQLTGYSARGKVEGGALGVYGNWTADALYVDASVQRGQFRNRVQGEGLAAERYNSDIWQSSLEAGYRFDIGQIGNTALRLQPELQLVYTDASTDRHEESNGTIVRSVGDDGVSGRLGLRLQGESRATVGAAVSPYLAVNWYRDGSSNGMAFDEDVLQASVPRNR